MTLVETAKLDGDKLFKGLGPEPLSGDFDAEYLAEALKGKKTPIKSALLDQRVVSGIGNIYVCEALFRARVSPKRISREGFGRAAAARSCATIKAVLKEAIKAGGSSLRDYASADGELGEFQHRFAVYDREGDALPDKAAKARSSASCRRGARRFIALFVKNETPVIPVPNALREQCDGEGDPGSATLTVPKENLGASFFKTSKLSPPGSPSLALPPSLFELRRTSVRARRG